MKNRNKNIPSHKAYKKAKKEHKKDFLRLHHLSVKCFVAETNKQKPKNDTKDQNENGRLDFIEEGSWGGLRIPRHIWTHFTSIVTLITTTFRRGRVIFVAMETFMSKELHFISKVSHYFSKDIVLLFELISLLFEPISLRFLCFVTKFFEKGFYYRWRALKKNLCQIWHSFSANVWCGVTRLREWLTLKYIKKGWKVICLLFEFEKN